MEKYLSFINQVKEDKYRMFWDITHVQTCVYSGPDTADNMGRLANIVDLLQMFKLMIILFKAQLIIWTDGITNFSHRFTWHLGAFCFNYCSQLIDSCRFCAIKLNGTIKYKNCNYGAPQNPYIMVEDDINLQGVIVLCGLSVLCVSVRSFFFANNVISQSVYIFLGTPCICVCVCVCLYMYI